jgi:hypothetical protein
MMGESIDHHGQPSWVASVYYAESVVNCSLEKAWTVLINYRAWNPTFADAEVALVHGQRSTEGEVVLIKKSLKDAAGEPSPEFYAETVKVVNQRRIVWYVYPRKGQAFRNFVDFGLTAASSGVKFNIQYYAQEQLPQELLIKNRKEYQAGLDHLAIAFKSYCESNV